MQGLVQAVLTGRIGGVGLDVFSKRDGLAYYRPRMYGRGDDKDPAIEAARAKARGPRRQAEWAAIFEKD